MADYYKRPPIFQPMPSIAQMGQENGGANYFGEPGMPPIAQEPSLDEQNAEFLGRSAEEFMTRIPNTAPYQAPNYNSGNYALPNNYQIGYNQNYSNPNDPTSTAYALQQNIKSLATGAASAKQNQKFQKGQHAQDLVRNFLAPLAATFGPNGAAQGVNEYMKTSNERAVKAKEMNLKEQADAITQMKTMADMLKDNNPYTKDQLEMIVKRATEEQKMRSEQALQAQREQAGKTDALQGAAHQAKALESTANIFNRRAAEDLTNKKANNEVLKGGKITAETKDKEEAAALKKDTREKVLPTVVGRNNAAALANNKRAAKTDQETKGLPAEQKSEETIRQKQIAFLEAKTAYAKKHKDVMAQGAHDGIATPQDFTNIMSKVKPGVGAQLQQIYEARLAKGKPMTQAQLYAMQSTIEEQAAARAAAAKAGVPGVGRPGIPELKF